MFGVLFLLLFPQGPAHGQLLLQWRLRSLPGVVAVERMPHEIPHIHSQYLILFEQPVDHADPGAGTFLQRVFLRHAGFDKPMVFVTEGYAVDEASYSTNIHELAKRFEAGEIVVEHRYFGESVPEGHGWDPLTAKNAAADHHRIVSAFQRLYQEKWISTGTSKGGTAALIHKMYYPDDVDITVLYSTPLNYGLVDGRHESYIISTPDPHYRTAVHALQLEVLQRRDSLMPMLQEYVSKHNLTFRVPLEEVYDYMVLQYSFSFYQWGYDFASIPWDHAADEELFAHWMKVSPPEYFAISDDYLPFFVQAARELGYYGYSIRGLWQELHIITTQDYFHRLFLPDSIDYIYDITLTQQIQTFLDSTDHRILFLYGEWDPWAASAVVFDWREKENMRKVLKEFGNHNTMIGNLPRKQREEVLERLNKCMAEPAPDRSRKRRK